MTRPPAFVLWLATLGSGVALGLAIGARGTALVAQVHSTTTAISPTTPSADDAAYQDLAKLYEPFRAVDRVFETVARVVTPSVVHITARKSGPRDDGGIGRLEESGSGVIVRSDAGKGLYILTNNHVVAGAIAVDVSIKLQDGQVIHPVKIWADPKVDVAVLKLERTDLPAARLGNSDDARVGSWVMALGSPFGLTHSVSQGIISARSRHEEELEIDGVEHQEFLQTDAAINPGNSGGPLVNLRGEVIGLNAAIASNKGGSDGVGFSIPINLAKWAMTQLISGGKVVRGAMGVNLQGISSLRAEELGFDRPKGARVVAVHEDSPASRAGLLVNDVVLRFNGIDVADDYHLINLVSICPIGKPSEIVVWRDRKSLPLRVTIADRDVVLAKSNPNGTPKRNSTNKKPAPARGEINPGLELTPLDDETTARFYGKVESKPKSVIVMKVETNSPFARYLQVGDLLESINSEPITNPEETLRLLARSTTAHPIEIVLRRVTEGGVQKKTVRVP
jgi:serine protease Do